MITKLLRTENMHIRLTWCSTYLQQKRSERICKTQPLAIHWSSVTSRSTSQRCGAGGVDTSTTLHAVAERLDPLLVGSETQKAGVGRSATGTCTQRHKGAHGKQWTGKESPPQGRSPAQTEGSSSLYKEMSPAQGCSLYAPCTGRSCDSLPQRQQKHRLS